MGKFKKLPNRYDIIDGNAARVMSQGENPGLYLEAELERNKWFVRELEKQQKAEKTNPKKYETAIKNTREQMRLINAKLEDIKYGTRNFALFRAEDQVASINREIKQASLPKEMLLRARLKKLKSAIQQIRYDNNQIRRHMHMLGFDKPKSLKGVTFEESTDTEIKL